MADAEAELEGFLVKFEPQVAAAARLLVAKMRGRIPGAQVLVYDNYNALAMGFGPTQKAGQAVLSLAVFPKWVTLCFLRGKGLPDPAGLLRGEGNQVRHVRLDPPERWDLPEVQALIAEALARAEPPFDPTAEPRLIIKSISARQRPRRLAPAPAAG